MLLKLNYYLILSIVGKIANLSLSSLALLVQKL